MFLFCFQFQHTGRYIKHHPMKEKEEKITVLHWPDIMIEHFLRKLNERDYADSTLLSYRKELYRYAEFYKKLNPNDFAFEKLANRTVFGKTLMEYHRHLLIRNKYRRKKLNIVSHLNTYVRSWNAFGLWISREFNVPFLPMKNFKKAKLLPKIIDLSIIKQKIDYSSRSWRYWRNVCILELVAYSGLKGIEIVELNISDINWETNEIQIKGNIPRIAYLDRLALSHLMYYCFYRPKQEEPALFYSSDRGRRINKAYLSTLISMLTQDICGTRIGCKVLRQSLVAHFYIKTHDSLAVTALFGYKSVKTALSYEAVDVPHFQAVMKRCHPRWYRR